MDDTDWETVMNVHLKGAFVASQTAQGYMVKQSTDELLIFHLPQRWEIEGKPTMRQQKLVYKGLQKRLRLNWVNSVLR